MRILVDKQDEANECCWWLLFFKLLLFISENFTSRYLPFLMRKLFFFCIPKIIIFSALAHTSPNFIFHNKLQYSRYYVTLSYQFTKIFYYFTFFLLCVDFLIKYQICFDLFIFFFLFLSLFFSTISTLL